MLSILMLMTLMLTVSVGNLALGYGLAVHFGHGPANGWNALCFWKRAAAATAHEAAAETAEAASHAPAHH